ncbi:MAG: hypothetical protein HUJ27_01275 [Rhodobacteraceae bacterium]|nr:hypothetical protein [Paracoccaceae bacterium]
MKDETTKVKPRARRGRRRRIGLWMLLSLAFMGAFLMLAALSLTGRPLIFPDWVTARIEGRVNGSIPQGRITLGALELFVDRSGVPRLALRNVGLIDGSGAELGRLNEVRARFDRAGLLQGNLAPDVLQLSGAQITLRRRVDGKFDLSLGSSRSTSGTLPALLDQVDHLFEEGVLSRVTGIEARELTVTLEDARSGRIWQVTGGSLTLGQDARTIDMTLAFEVFNGTEELAKTVIGFRTEKGSPKAAFGASFENAAAADIAAQSPVLSFLQVIDAPISGAIRAEIGENGLLRALAGTLEVEEGALRPNDATTPIVFNEGKGYFSYDPTEEVIHFSEVSAETGAAVIAASGKAYLRDFEDGWPQTFLGQMRLTDVVVRPEGVFADQLRFSEGILDVKVALDPFAATIGQLVLVDGERRYRLKGDVQAGPEGWEVAADLGLNSIEHDELLSLWPVTAAPNTRDWLVRNVQTGRLFDVKGAIRLKPNTDPVIFLSYDFANTGVRPVRTLPPVNGGHGYATLEGTRYTLVMDGGHMVAPNGEKVDLGNSVFVVPDVSIKQGPANLTLRVNGGIPAVLSLLNLPPFRIMDKAGRDPDFVDGTADLEGIFRFNLVPRLMPEDVEYEVSGELLDLSTDNLVEGKTIAAPLMSLVATPEQLEIFGQGRIDDLPFDATWIKPMGPENQGLSRVLGRAELSQRFLDTFSIALPERWISGRAFGDFSLEFGPDAPPAFALRSNLEGLGLRLPELAWSKSPNTAGAFEVAGALGEIPTVDRIAMSAPGLEALGKIAFGEGGSFAEANFERVSASGWFDAPVILTSRGARRLPAIEIPSGRLDMRRLSAGGGAGNGGAQPISVALDRLVVSEGITLTGFRGNLNSGPSGLDGPFRARINGGARISGQLAPSRTGTTVAIYSEVAGAAAADAGVLENLRGGELNMSLAPTGSRGVYRGKARITGARISQAPAMAELLSAISVIGLLEQLDGKGIMLSDIEADFELTPTQVRLLKSSAIGPSLGISLDGIYDLTDHRMNMQGVISPFFIVNSLGSILTRKGEGLFGFSFNLKGQPDDPKVSVFPLSILTPGMFREIFRRPPPEPTNNRSKR